MYHLTRGEPKTYQVSVVTMGSLDPDLSRITYQARSPRTPEQSGTKPVWGPIDAEHDFEADAQGLTPSALVWSRINPRKL